MASATLTTLDPVMKQLYKGQRVPMMSYKNRAFLAILAKDESFYGRNLPLPIQYSCGGGGSNSIADAIADTTSPTFEDFLLTRKSDYSIGTIDGEAIEASAADKGSFIRGLKAVVDSKLRVLSNRMAAKLFRDGTGAMSQITSWTANDTFIELADDGGIACFEVGDQICTTDTSATESRLNDAAGGENVHITGVKRSARYLLTGVDIDNTITAIANDNWVVNHGDRQNAAMTAGLTADHLCMEGLDSWVPESAPAANLFFNVDRTAESRLGGMRLDASGYALQEEAIIDASGMVDQEGGSCDVFVLHPAKFRQLIKELGSKVQYDKLQARGAKGEIAHIGFRTVVLDGVSGPVKVVSDRFCPLKRGWALDMSTWKLYTLGQAPKILQHDGNKMLRIVDSDGYEIRMGCRGNLGCNAPGWNCCTVMPV